jgi:two-component system phosphate regulon sensor histidine kinase PhoR
VRLRRRLAAALVALVCAAVGVLVASLSQSALAGWLGGMALGLGAILLFDARKMARLLTWLRADAEAERPEQVGSWGDMAYQIQRALQRRERNTEAERNRLTQFLAAVEASPIGVLLLDVDNQITWCSRVAADHLGLDPKRDLGQPVTNLVRAPAFVEHMSAPRAGPRTARAPRDSSELQAPDMQDGGEPWQAPVSFAGQGDARLSALVQPYGEGLKLILTQDITERERAEAMRRNFVANVSHEIRTPLTVLAGFVETMSQLPLSEVERKRVLALMAEQAQRMQALVADLLTLAQLEGSPRPVADHWLQVGHLMQRARVDALSLSAGRHETSFKGGDDAQIAGNETELHSALGNLVANAVRYTPQGGRVDVRWIWLEDGWGVFEVRDTGIGIEREHLPRLTERFYRVDGSRSRDTGGTGLGLSIVKHVLQRHGGEIDVRSEPGKGSTFRLLLPPSRVRNVAARPVGPSGVPGPG